MISGQFKPTRPDKLLARAYEALAKPPRPTGSSTACVLIVHQDTLYSANLGDSGYLVIRNGEIVYRSREQTHYFNAPYQLSLPPADEGGVYHDGCFILNCLILSKYISFQFICTLLSMFCEI